MKRAKYSSIVMDVSRGIIINVEGSLIQLAPSKLCLFVRTIYLILASIQDSTLRSWEGENYNWWRASWNNYGWWSSNYWNWQCCLPVRRRRKEPLGEFVEVPNASGPRWMDWNERIRKWLNTIVIIYMTTMLIIYMLIVIPDSICIFVQKSHWPNSNWRGLNPIDNPSPKSIRRVCTRGFKFDT